MRNWDKFQARRWRHGWGVPDPKEGLIEQSRHMRSGGRTKTPAQSLAIRRFGRAVIIVAALVLVALAWVGARDAISAHRGEARARVQAEVLAATQAIEEQLRRELLSLDQTLRILEYEWERDPDHFDLAARAGQTVVLSDVSLQLFIADSQGIVRASTRPGDHRHRRRQPRLFPLRGFAGGGRRQDVRGRTDAGPGHQTVADQPGPSAGEPGRHIRRRDRSLVRHQFVHAILSPGRSRHAWPDRRGQRARWERLVHGWRWQGSHGERHCGHAHLRGDASIGRG